MMEIPLFPLNSVLFPGGALPLRIFESRYIDMVSRCMKQQSCFGIVMIKSGKEVADAPEVYDYGTLADIHYFEKLEGGLLGITARGGQRFHIKNSWVETNQLRMAEVELLTHEETLEMSKEYRPWAELVAEILQQLGPPYSVLPCDYDNATWVSHRLAELLPIERELKQLFLQMQDPQQRLERIIALLSNSR
ncbi:MAG: LON peptidase substrate-binding domain-containing protein [Gammaproteobacteria bacterium]|nr:LON peptidase substrate-binding domain-containing protein [Gammaproteobacteria bacterium]